MVTSTFSQNTLPRTIVSNKDTGVLVSLPQFKQTILLFVDRDRLRITVDSLNSEIELWQHLSDNKTKEINMQEEEVKILNGINTNYEKLVLIDEKAIKKQKLYKWSAYGIGVVLLTLLILK